VDEFYTRFVDAFDELVVDEEMDCFCKGKWSDIYWGRPEWME
jgi:hypothetical protein